MLRGSGPSPDAFTNFQKKRSDKVRTHTSEASRVLRGSGPCPGTLFANSRKNVRTRSEPTPAKLAACCVGPDLVRTLFTNFQKKRSDKVRTHTSEASLMLRGSGPCPDAFHQLPEKAFGQGPNPHQRSQEASRPWALARPQRRPIPPWCSSPGRRARARRLRGGFPGGRSRGPRCGGRATRPACRAS